MLLPPVPRVLLDLELLAPQVVHVVHHRVEHGEEEEEEVDPEQAREVEGKVVVVWQADGEALSLLKVGDVAQHDDALAEEAQRVERDPKGVPGKSQRKLTE